MPIIFLCIRNFSLSNKRNYIFLFCLCYTFDVIEERFKVILSFRSFGKKLIEKFVAINSNMCFESNYN